MSFLTSWEEDLLRRQDPLAPLGGDGSESDADYEYDKVTPEDACQQMAQ